MKILPLEWLQTIKAFDSSLDVLWNERKNVWVVVQDVVACGGGWRTPGSDLIGCSAITGKKTRFKSLFRCQFKDGHKFEPRPWWVIRFVEEFYPKGDRLRDGKLFEESEKVEQEAWAKDDHEFNEDIAHSITRHLTTKTVDMSPTPAVEPAGVP